jgi:hypothetical protein
VLSYCIICPIFSTTAWQPQIRVSSDAQGCGFPCGVQSRISESGTGLLRNGGHHRFYTKEELKALYPHPNVYIRGVVETTMKNLAAGYLHHCQRNGREYRRQRNGSLAAAAPCTAGAKIFAREVLCVCMKIELSKHTYIRTARALHLSRIAHINLDFVIRARTKFRCGATLEAECGKSSLDNACPLRDA